MAIIRTLHDFLGKKLYPKTVTKAVYDVNGNRLDVILEEMKTKGNDIYSEQEIDTGKKWIDGKTIYRKCYKITADNINILNEEEGTMLVDSLPNLDTITYGISSTVANNVVNNENVRAVMMTPYIELINGDLCTYFTVPKDIISEVNVIVEYTKL